jgi:hypothetical protein
MFNSMDSINVDRVWHPTGRRNMLMLVLVLLPSEPSCDAPVDTSSCLGMAGPTRIA